MTNTINNVPRDWVERVHALLYEIAHQQGQIGEEAECLSSFIPDILSAPVQQVSVPETYGLPPLPWSLRKCNHIYEDYPESLGGKPGFKPVYLEPFGLCIGQTHLDWPLADFILACVNSAAPATPAADAGLVEALEKIAVYAPCSGIKDPGLTKMHMGILARDALAAHRAKGVV